MKDFEFVWLCTARLEQTIDLLIEALHIDEDPEGTGEKTVEAIGKARWFARLTRGFACAKLCDLARQMGLPNAESWNFEFASELQKLEQPGEIRPILADLQARHRALVTASESLLIGKRTPNERFPDCKFVWDLSLTMKYLRSALDEIERIDRDLLNHVPTCTFDEKRRASFDYTFWIRRAIRFPSERLAGIASRYGVSNQSFWNLEFSTRLDRLLHGMYDVNESIEMVIGFRHVWDPVRYVLLNDAFMTEEPTRRSKEPAEASLTQVEPAILPTTPPPCSVGSTNGPVRPDGFCWENKLIDGLTPTEFDLLAFIFERQESPPTLKELTSVFWKDSLAENGSFHKFASNLRTKLVPLGIAIHARRKMAVILPVRNGKKKSVRDS